MHRRLDRAECSGWRSVVGPRDSNPEPADQRTTVRSSAATHATPRGGTGEGATPLIRREDRYPASMAYGRLHVQRLAFAVIALIATVGMHGSGASAHSCGATDRAAEIAADHQHYPGHGPATPNGSTIQHCASMACAAIVVPATDPEVTRVPHRASLRPEALRIPSGNLAAPEPPVPRLSLHV